MSSPDDNSPSTDPGEAQRTPEQEENLQRHLRHQRGMRSGHGQNDGGIFSPIANTGAGIVLRTGLSIIRAGFGAFSRASPGDVAWQYPIGMLIVVFGVLVCGLGLVVWLVLASILAIYRGIRQGRSK